MKILERYILARVVRLFLATLLPVLAILWLTQVLGRINLVTDSGQSILSFLTLATLILPTVIPTVLPFGLVLGAAQTLTTMNNDSELAVIDAAGAHRSIIYRPILIFAVVLCAFSFVLDNYIEPKSRAEARTLIASVYADLLSTVIEEKTFREIEDGLYIQISERLSGRVLKGLFVADYREADNSYIYYAREGAVDESGSQLIMKNGQVQREDETGNVSIVQFDSYSFDLSELTSDRSQASRKATDRSLGFLLNPDPEDPDYRANPGAYRAELTRRLTDWSLPLIYAIFTIVIVGDARSHRERRIPPMATAFVLTLILRLMSQFSTNRAESDALFVPISYGIVIVLFALGLYLLLKPRRARRNASLLERTNAAFSRMIGRGARNDGGAA
ncbi:MAG: LPS export ABC transporter permease LptF [Rhizobiaceae bacterium]|nr:LPS export ABC transporter permease LptF [Rhizobiaceae bacterium]